MKDLVQIIKDNPDCFAQIDNDDWILFSQNPYDLKADVDPDDYILTQAGEVKSLGDGGYGSGNCYGGDILQALAAIVGITVESV